MALYCPSCKNEILPYLRTGEFKQIQIFPAKSVVFDDCPEYLVSYQFYFCVHCKKVYKEVHEKYPITDLKEEVKIAENTRKASNTIKGKDGK